MAKKKKAAQPAPLVQNTWQGNAAQALNPYQPMGGSQYATNPSPFPIYGGQFPTNYPSAQLPYASGKENTAVMQALPNIPTPVGSVPQYGRVLGGQHGGFTPGEAANILDSRDASMRQAYDTRLGGALGMMQSQAQSALGTYSAAAGDLGKAQLEVDRNYKGQLGLVDQLGQREYSDIADRLRQQQGANSQDMVSRGLGNSTIGSTMNRGYLRDATLARQAVDQYKAQASIGIMGNQAQSKQQFGQNMADVRGQQAGIQNNLGQNYASTLLGGSAPLLQDRGGDIVAGSQQAKEKPGAAGQAVVGSILGSVGGSVLGGLTGGLTDNVSSGIGSIFRPKSAGKVPYTGTNPYGP